MCVCVDERRSLNPKNNYTVRLQLHTFCNWTGGNLMYKFWNVTVVQKTTMNINAIIINVIWNERKKTRLLRHHFARFRSKWHYIFIFFIHSQSKKNFFYNLSCLYTHKNVFLNEYFNGNGSASNERFSLYECFGHHFIQFNKHNRIIV